MRLLRASVLMALISMTAGCLSHREQRHVYSLDAPVDASSGAAGSLPVVQLKRVLIPDYLDTTDIELRAGAHEMRESKTGRFAERLSLGVTHALRTDLAARLPRYTVALTQPADAPARQILVDIDAFDVDSAGRCVLAADWTVVQNRKTVAVDRGTFRSAAKGTNPGDAAIVAAMAETVQQLAARIASSIDESQPN
jgi:uncharacterized protein